MNPENMKKFIDIIFETMDTQDILFSLHEFPLGSTDLVIRDNFYSYMRQKMNNAAKKALLEYFESNEDITPEMVIDATKHLQAYDWGESGIVEKALTDSQN